MKLAEHDNKLETNVKTVSQDFGIGDASVVIEILRNRLYEHKIRTLVQEYMCNGRDAQREVKQTKRLIVSVPNSLSPVFKVRDFGPGITPERMAKVFVLYGASTKRDSSGQTGGFGIGAKSAWSYTDSFTIVSITEGMKRTYVAHTGVNNQGQLSMLSEIATDEETGTEIQVAIKPLDSVEFRNAIQRASYFWTEEERPEFRGMTKDMAQFHTENLRLGKTLEVNKIGYPDFLQYSYADKCMLVIDGIPYPLSEKLANKIDGFTKLHSQLRMVFALHIPNGIVEVGANRESIADSEFTRNALKEIVSEASQVLKEYCLKRFKDVKTNSEWLLTYNELSAIAIVDSHSTFGPYKIERGEIESNSFAEIDIASISTNWRPSKVNIDSYGTRCIRLDRLDKVYYVDNTDESQIIQNKRIREFLEKNKSGMTLLKAAQTMMADPVNKNAAGQPLQIVKTSLAKSEKTLAKIVKDFNAKPLSSLPFTPVVRVPKYKRDRTKEMFTIHLACNSGKSPKTTTLEAVDKDSFTYLYVSLDEYPKMREELCDMYDYLKERNFKTCFLSNKTIEMVEDSKLFVPYSDWKSKLKISTKAVTAVKSVKASNLLLIKFLRAADIKIKDKHIVKMLVEYEGIVDKDREIPLTIQKIVSEDLTSFIEGDKELTRLIKECYPLVNELVRNYSHPPKSVVNEVIIYINAKA